MTFEQAIFIAIAFFVASVAALKNGDHATSQQVKNVADGVGVATFLTAAVFLFISLTKL